MYMLTHKPYDKQLYDKPLDKNYNQNTTSPPRVDHHDDDDDGEEYVHEELNSRSFGPEPGTGVRGVAVRAHIYEGHERDYEAHIECLLCTCLRMCRTHTFAERGIAIGECVCAFAARCYRLHMQHLLHRLHRLHRQNLMTCIPRGGAEVAQRGQGMKPR